MLFWYLIKINLIYLVIKITLQILNFGNLNVGSLRLEFYELLKKMKIDKVNCEIKRT